MEPVPLDLDAEWNESQNVLAQFLNRDSLAAEYSSGGDLWNRARGCRAAAFHRTDCPRHAPQAWFEEARARFGGGANLSPGFVPCLDLPLAEENRPRLNLAPRHRVSAPAASGVGGCERSRSAGRVDSSEASDWCHPECMVRFKFPGERDSDAESQGADLIVMGVRKGAAWPRPIALGHCLRHGVPRALSGSDGAAENVAGMRCGRFYAVPLFFEGSLR